MACIFAKHQNQVSCTVRNEWTDIVNTFGTSYAVLFGADIPCKTMHYDYRLLPPVTTIITINDCRVVLVKLNLLTLDHRV